MGPSFPGLLPDPLPMIVVSLTPLGSCDTVPCMAGDPSEHVSEVPGGPVEPVFAPQKYHVSKAEAYKALVATRGNMSAAARELGVPRSVMSKVAGETPEIQEMLQDFREEIVDTAEDNIFEDVRKGDASQSRFIAQTLGKSRGYSTAVEGTGKGGAITVNIVKFTEDPANG